MAAVFFFLPVAGAFAVGCGLRYLFRKAPCPWVLTLILLVPALYFGWSYCTQSADGGAGSPLPGPHLMDAPGAGAVRHPVVHHRRPCCGCHALRRNRPCPGIITKREPPVSSLDTGGFLPIGDFSGRSPNGTGRRPPSGSCRFRLSEKTRRGSSGPLATPALYLCR